MPGGAVFITGASSGLGAAFAREYARRGATAIGLVARRGAETERLAGELGRPCAAYPTDVRDAHAMQSAAADFIGRFGAPRVVIANAGVSRGTLTDHPEDLPAFRSVIEINLLGMVHTFQPFIEPMRRAGGGRLAGIASVAGIRGLPGSGAYSASKAAVIAYLESLRVEMAESGIRVVTIAPGYVATPMTAINPYAMPFILQPDEAARRIVNLIEAGRSYAVVPWQMAVVAKLLRMLPNFVYDRLFAHAGRKPR